jgi:molybdenum cofactor cytidylyltransferase
MKPVFKYPLLILAAGESSRMGTPKGLLKVGEQNFLDYQIETYREHGGGDVFVIFGNHIKEYSKGLEWFGEQSKAKVLINPNPKRGQFSSIIIGLLKIYKLGHPGAFILPIDVPCPTENVWRTLEYSLAGELFITSPQYSERVGHPILVSRNFMHGLFDMPIEGEDARLDHQIQKLTDEQKKLVPVVDPTILENLNTPEQWEAFKATIETL